MIRFVRSIAPLIACLAATWQPSSALAQDEDVQLWVLANVEGDLDENTGINVDYTYRWRDRIVGADQETLRVTIDQKVADNIVLGGGIGVFDAAGSTEIRVTQQMGLRRGGWSSRTRLEQRFFDGADRMELRLRQRIRYTHKLAPKLKGSIEGEFLYLAQTQREDPRIPRDQWRWRAFASYDLNDHLTLGAAYMLIHTPGGEVTDKVNHVPQAIVTYRF